MLLDPCTYLCEVTIINVENSTTVTEVSGTHLEGKNNEDVKAFVIRNQTTITKIPEGIEKFFADLELFIWEFGHISTIDSSTFKPFPNLVFIDLGNNRLVTLNSNLFQHTRKLRVISFAGNLLEQVGHDLLTGLTGVQTNEKNWQLLLSGSFNKYLELN